MVLGYIVYNGDTCDNPLTSGVQSHKVTGGHALTREWICFTMYGLWVRTIKGSLVERCDFIIVTVFTPCFIHFISHLGNEEKSVYA